MPRRRRFVPPDGLNSNCRGRFVARAAPAKMTLVLAFESDCVMGLRLGLRSSWHEPAAAEPGELGETIRAYTPDNDGLPVRRGTMARKFILMIVLAFAIAGAVALLWPPAATPELATGSVSPGATTGVDKGCAGQTWPYLASECLTRKP